MQNRIHQVAILAVLFAVAWAPATLVAADYVIQISVDGLGVKYLETLLAEGRLPTFERLAREGAWTHNARTDFDYTVTLPNHTSMVTGRPVLDKAASPHAITGHQWVTNGDPKDETLHQNCHEYVASTFDVAHDNGLRTAMFPSKSKFALYNQSYRAQCGGPDRTGPDNGRCKIDLYFETKNSQALVARLLEAMAANPIHYVFLHLHDCDSAGHADGWGSPEYDEALVAVDGYLAELLNFVATNPKYREKTALIITADHGGLGTRHDNRAHPRIYAIPFYVWGAGVAAGKDLYALNTDSRLDPQLDRPDYTSPGLAPIRNGDGGNLAMSLLGLPAIPGSLIDAAQDLKVR